MTLEGWEQIRQRDHTFNALRGEQLKALKKKDAQEEVIKEEKIFGGGQEYEIVGKGQYNRENDC
jgi:hypothetical protein